MVYNTVIYDTVIIGAGPAGITSAIQLKRSGFNILLIEKNKIGGLLRNANKIENYIGFSDGISAKELIASFGRQLSSFGIKLISGEVYKITKTALIPNLNVRVFNRAVFGTIEKHRFSGPKNPAGFLWIKNCRTKVRGIKLQQFLIIKKFIMLVILIGFLLSTPVYAEITSLTITADIEGTTAFIDYVLKVTNKTEELPLRGEIIYARDIYGDIKFDNKEIELLVPLEENEERIVLIKIKTKEIISKKEDFTEYVYIHSLNNFNAITKHNVILPENSELIETLPASKEQLLDNRMIIIWDETDNVYIIRYREKEQLFLPYVLAGITIAVFIFFGRWYVNKNKQEREKKGMLNSLKLLNEKEKEIVKLIIESPGITQYKIMEHHKITKSNLSKIIKKLSFNGIIEKRDIGRINKLYPGEKLKQAGRWNWDIVSIVSKYIDI